MGTAEEASTAAAGGGRILRVLTVNVGVAANDPLLSRLSAMGHRVWEPAAFPDPPGQIVDTTVQLGGSCNLSLVTPLARESSIQRFLDRRGPGLASMTVEVDDLDKTMQRWSAAGVEWLQAEPEIYRDVDFGDVHAEVARTNWTKTSSLYGLSFEVVEFQGGTTPRTNWLGADGVEPAR
jgi:hypothetical protein